MKNGVGEQVKDLLSQTKIEINDNVELKGLGYDNIVNYIQEKTGLKVGIGSGNIVIGELIGGNGIFMAINSEIVTLGNFDFQRFIRVNQPPLKNNGDLIALKKILDLCCDKINNLGINVPQLFGNPEGWDKIYSKIED